MRIVLDALHSCVKDCSGDEAVSYMSSTLACIHLGSVVGLLLDMVSAVRLPAVGLCHLMHELYLLCSNCSLHDIGKGFNRGSSSQLEGFDYLER